MEVWFRFEYDRKALELLKLVGIPTTVKELAEWKENHSLYDSHLTNTLLPWREGNVPKATYQEPFLFVLYKLADLGYFAPLRRDQQTQTQSVKKRKHSSLVT